MPIFYNIHKRRDKVKGYQLKVNPVIQAVPGNLIYDELGKEILARHNENFKGVREIEDRYDYKEGQPLSFSNTPRFLDYNQILRERFPELGIRGLSDVEVVQYWNTIPERDETYADTNSIVVYPKEGPNEDLRQRVLGIIGKKSRLPLVVSNLGVEPADNNHGFTFVGTDFTEAREAPYLRKDGRVSFNGKELVSSEEGVDVWTQDSQSGLRGLYRVGSDRLSAGNADLLYSFECGRVQVIQDPQGRAENLDSLVKQLEEQRNKELAEINKRFEEASNYLRTGKL